jgi:hypothetical protein
MAKIIDNMITLRILMMLTTPFKFTDAYRLGIIDDSGKELKSIRDLTTDEEQNAYTLLHRLVFRLKRIIHLVPGEQKNFLSFAAAYALVKENVDPDDEYLEELFYMTQEREDVKQLAEDLKENKLVSFKSFIDEEMGVAGGAIAGIGIENPHKANQAEPGVSKAMQKKWRNKNKIFRRK